MFIGGAQQNHGRRNCDTVRYLRTNQISGSEVEEWGKFQHDMIEPRQRDFILSIELILSLLGQVRLPNTLQRIHGGNRLVDLACGNVDHLISSSDWLSCRKED